MTPKLCAATNDTREEPSSNINYFFCERTRLRFPAFVPRSGHRPPLYLLHYLSVNTNRMDASDGLKFPCLVRQLSAVTRASVMDIKLFMGSFKIQPKLVNDQAEW